jgi:hypothetical protein
VASGSPVDSLMQFHTQWLRNLALYCRRFVCSDVIFDNCSFRLLTSGQPYRAHQFFFQHRRLPHEDPKMASEEHLGHEDTARGCYKRRMDNARPKMAHITFNASIRHKMLLLLSEELRSEGRLIVGMRHKLSNGILWR